MTTRPDVSYDSLGFRTRNSVLLMANVLGVVFTFAVIMYGVSSGQPLYITFLLIAWGAHSESGHLPTPEEIGASGTRAPGARRQHEVSVSLRGTASDLRLPPIHDRLSHFDSVADGGPQ